MLHQSDDFTNLKSFRDQSSTTNEATIAVWGAEHAGKSTFLGALELAAINEGLALWSADAYTERTLEFQRERRARHQFPEPASKLSPQDQPPLRFGLRSVRAKREMILNLVELSARWWAKSDAESLGSLRVSNAAEIPLHKCAGLICLIDPTKALTRAHNPALREDSMPEADTNTELQNMLAQLRHLMTSSHARLDTKIALCLTQMDRPEHYAHLGKEEAYFRRIFGPVLVHNWVERPNWRFFGCSAVGILRRAGYVISNTYEDEEGQEYIIDPYILPIHLFRPIKWILSLA